MHEEGIVENAERIGRDVLGPGLPALQDKHPVIGEVRGLGVFWALDLVTDRVSKEPIAPYRGTSPAMAALVTACKDQGVLSFTNYHRLHAVPLHHHCRRDARRPRRTRPSPPGDGLTHPCSWR
jgi:taurine--2-oxoglutarate transaminase